MVLKKEINKDAKGNMIKIKSLFKKGIFKYELIIYKDFLPFLAVGIFKSNLRNKGESLAIII